MMILSSLCLLLAAACLYLMARLRTNKQQIAQAMEVLEDISEGNLDRKIIADEGSDVAALCFRLNKIVAEIKQQLSRLQVSEKEYRQLITSLSHDVRTPLASLIGYLEAINDGLVTEEEQREYLQASQAKAFELEKYMTRCLNGSILNQENAAISLKPTMLQSCCGKLLVNGFHGWSRNFPMIFKSLKRNCITRWMSRLFVGLLIIYWKTA